MVLLVCLLACTVFAGLWVVNALGVLSINELVKNVETALSVPGIHFVTSTYMLEFSNESTYKLVTAYGELYGEDTNLMPSKGQVIVNTLRGKYLETAGSSVKAGKHVEKHELPRGEHCPRVPSMRGELIQDKLVMISEERFELNSLNLTFTGKVINASCIEDKCFNETVRLYVTSNVFRSDYPLPTDKYFINVEVKYPGEFKCRCCDLCGRWWKWKCHCHYVNNCKYCSKDWCGDCHRTYIGSRTFVVREPSTLIIPKYSRITLYIPIKREKYYYGDVYAIVINNS